MTDEEVKKVIEEIENRPTEGLSEELLELRKITVALLKSTLEF